MDFDEKNSFSFYCGYLIPLLGSCVVVIFNGSIDFAPIIRVKVKRNPTATSISASLKWKSFGPSGFWNCLKEEDTEGFEACHFAPVIESAAPGKEKISFGVGTHGFVPPNPTVLPHS